MHGNDVVDTETAVAVIGLSCRVPGASGADAYWRNLLSGHCAIARLDDAALATAGVGARDRNDAGVVRAFGVLDDIDRFDAALFGLPPRRAALLDPQQRLLLEAAWAALENAGYPPDGTGRTIGTYVSLTQSTYFPEIGAGGEDAVFALTASEKDYAASRIAHKLGLTGPAMVVQSACSSALLAVHTAVEALTGGQCDMAIAGGVSITLPQGAYRHIPGLMLSPAGVCRAFDAAADGTVPGNGVGIVVLKPLAKALADGDPIRAVILGSAANNDGAVKADYLAPSVAGQARVVGEALAVAGLDPSDIGMIEAHATGTRLGDPIEVQALAKVFGGLPAGSIALGSVKSSIGHLNAASGIAGLIKAILAVEHGVIPPSHGFAVPNPEIRFGETPFHVLTKAVAWPEARVRRAGVSSFGFGGTNVHVVIEAPPAVPPRPPASGGPWLFPVSAMDAERLAAAKTQLVAALTADPELRLDDVAWTLMAGRKALPARWVARAADRTGLLAILRGEAASLALPPEAVRWSAGDTLDWTPLRPDGARRTRLPAYPFAPTRHWARLRGVLPAPTGLSWNDEAVPEAPVRGGPDTSGSISDYLVGEIAQALGRPVAEIDAALPLVGYGLDSLLIVAITNRLKLRFPGLRDTALFDHETPAALAAYLVEQFPDAARAPDPAREPASSAIAVIGMAGCYPGAPDLGAFWSNLQAGRMSLGPAPAKRWNAGALHDAERRDGSYVLNGGFLDDVDRFDPVFFGVAPREARLMDPQQRLFLETVWAAVEDAGYTPAGLKASAPTGVTGDVGVFAGVMNQPYRLVGHAAALAGQVLQSGHWSVANRISYHFDFHGPSLAIDTACSASLAAVHLACASLRNRECGVAIAGGVNLVLHPVQQVELCRIGMLSPSDACRPFADGADGTLQGEGVGAVVLKPLDAALADGDHVHAVILGSATDAGGRTSGYTVPSAAAQRRVIAAAIEAAGVPADTIACFECHGTGTDLGDPIEAHGLADALDGAGRGSAVVRIGSVKGNIGHLESAAGIAGLSKLILQISHGQTVPSLGTGTPSRRIDFAGARLELARGLAPWPAVVGQDGRPVPRRGGVSSFGAGGANVHVVVEQAPVRGPRGGAATRPLAFPLSARSPDRLAAVAARLAEHVAAMTDQPGLLDDIAWTLGVGRVALDCRTVVLASDRSELVTRLNRAARGEAGSGIVAGTVSGVSPDAADIETLAWVWCAGGSVDWRLPLGSGRRRVPLPAYPFAGGAYWIDVASHQTGEGLTHRHGPFDVMVGDGPPPMALLSKDVDAHLRRQGEEARPESRRHHDPASPASIIQDAGWQPPGEAIGGPLRRRLRVTAGDPLVAGHQVQGLPMLPGVAYVLWAMAAADAGGFPGHRSARDVFWVRPLVAGGGPIDAELSMVPGDDGIAFSVSGPDGLCCRGRLVRTASPGAPPPATRDAAVEGGEALYRRLAATGLDYGGPYRAIATLSAGPDHASAVLAPWAEGFTGWPFPPPLLDAALQTAAAVACAASEQTLVPFACGAIDIIGPARNARTIRASRAPADPDDKAVRFDSWIVGDDGSVVARLGGLVARAMGADRRRMAVAPRADTGIGADFYVPVWHDEPATAAVEAGPMLVLAGPAGAVQSGQIRALAGGKPSRFGALPAAGDESAATALAAEAARCGTVVIALGRQGECDDTPEVYGLLALFRALKRSALLERLRIVVLTEGAQRVLPEDDPPAFATAALGIARVAAQECRRWRIACVDVGAPDDLASAVTDPGDTVGREIAYRNGRRFVARLEPRPFAAGRAPWRPGGHYVILGGAGGIGAALARDLAGRHGARLTLIGRTQEGEPQRALVAEIAARGGEAMYVAADGADMAALAAALAAGRKRFGPIRGAVHSAIVMQDRALEHMDDARFDAAFRIKAAGCAALAAATSDDPLDFLLLFSSANSFAAMPGQANYVAGCLAKDGFGHKLARQGRTVRIVNWGFWGEVGRVATPEYRERLAKAGVRALTTEEGLDAIDRALAGDAEQVLVLKADDAALAALGVVTAAVEADGLEAAERDYDALDRVARRAVVNWWTEAGLIGSAGSRFRLADVEERLGPAPRHGRLIDAMVDILVREGALGAGTGSLVATSQGIDVTADNADRAALAAGPYQAHLLLLDEAVAAYRAVLTGRRPATDVLFPGGSLDRVMPMYAGNPMVDHYTAAAAGAIAAGAGAATRVLEFGGGTGGLTGVVMPLLDRLGGVADYRFTDLSPRFCREAEHRFGAGRPWFSTGLLDIGRDAVSQGLDPGTFDVVAGANVIHATASIGDSLATVRGLLKPGGIVVLYEMMRLHDYVTATFGLLDGWWAATDQRLPHCPLLDADGWRRALAGAGFENVRIEGGARHGVVVARRPVAAVAIPVAEPSASPAQSRNPLLRRREAARAVAVEPVGVLEAVIGALSEALELPVVEIRADRAFSEYGTDSILSVDVVAAINRRLGIQLKPTILFSHTTAIALARHIGAEHGAGVAARTSSEVPRAVTAHAVPEPIAIVGASGRFPGAADLDAFWSNLAAGTDCVGAVPRSRWDHAALSGTSGRTNCRDGGFLDGIELFDPLFFNVSPAEATAMDPQQRLFLEEAWRALEDAARAGPDLAGSRTGVFAGTVTGDYAEILRRNGAAIDAHGFMGNAAAMLAARTAFHFDLTGPAMSIDTACSSALVAIHQACESLRAGGCDMALAGGVAVMTTPAFYLAGASAGMLSATGRCRALDAGADGFVPGEGVGVFVLRRLRDAVADDDPIRGVIVASGVNQDGASNGITAPNGAAQTRLIRETYARYGIDPASLGMIELHGTGTRLGDPIEMEALAAAYAGAEPPEGGWRIGSAKSGIGHALAAAGAAGLAKALLALEHGAMPPTLHLRAANPLLDFRDGAFRPVTKLTPWPRGDTPRRAAVSAFGFGGTNAHLVIEEAPATRTAVADGGGQLPVILSAESPAALTAAMDGLVAWMDGPGRDVGLADISATLATGRRRMRCRAAFVAENTGQLRRLLRDADARQAAVTAPEMAVPEVRGRRIRLPTYRFDRRRCWPEPLVESPRPRRGMVGRIVADLETLRLAGAEVE
jgi:acyl transferase domain-containing protein/NAD(P)-dependent dehydrogenase (short-subunit alcohol dehydrogenase family)/SAM-dependent methyltransferase